MRIPFIHARSPHDDAVPLLLIPPFPLTNLSLAHLIPRLTNPQDATASQPFHVVIPTLPGLGFSDPLPPTAQPIAASADILNTLMTSRLSYAHYLVTNASRM